MSSPSAAGGDASSPGAAGHGAKKHHPVGDGKHHISPPSNMPSASASAFVDKIDPFSKKSSLKRKQKKLQGSSRYRTEAESELQQLPALKGKISRIYLLPSVWVLRFPKPSMLRLHISFAFQKYLNRNRPSCSSKNCDSVKCCSIFSTRLLISKAKK